VVNIYTGNSETVQSILKMRMRCLRSVCVYISFNIFLDSSISDIPKQERGGEEGDGEMWKYRGKIPPADSQEPVSGTHSTTFLYLVFNLFRTIFSIYAVNGMIWLKLICWFMKVRTAREVCYRISSNNDYQFKG
jgi:hypothetical protein